MKTFAKIALLLAFGSGCSAADTTDLSGPLGAPSARTLDGSAKRDDGLRLETNTSDRLEGTFERGNTRVAFEILHDGQSRMAALYRADDTLLARLTSAPDRESLEMGDDVTIDGPQGSLFGRHEPDWAVLHTSGDPARIAGLSAGPEFSVFAELGRALAARTDIDPSVLPSALAYSDPAEGYSGSDIGKSEQGLNFGTPACIACIGGCTAWSFACGNSAGWAASWVCAPPSILCYGGCLAGACQ